MPFQDIDRMIETFPKLIFDNAIVIAFAALLAWALTSLALLLVRHRDTRVTFLSEFLDVEPDRIIPLPPGNALWAEYYRMNKDAVADSHFPCGAPSLQGAYLVHAKGGMTVVVIHNFDKVDLYHDPEEPELLDFIEPSIGVHGRQEAHRLPVDIDQDAANRANIVEFFLKAKFGYPGKVRVITLLRDDRNIAPEPETLFTPSGENILRMTFEDQDIARDALRFDDAPVEAKTLPQIKSWLVHYAGRQTSMFRLITRTCLLVLCAALIFNGQRGVDPVVLEQFLRGGLH